MSIVFFEGFNTTNNNDAVKLDFNYWSTNDNTKLSFGGGRTGGQIFIENHATNFSSPSYNTLSLSNFQDPIVSNSGFGLGFYCNNFSLRTNNIYNSASPHGEKFLSFYDNFGEVLRIDIIKINDFIYHSKDDHKYFKTYEEAELACLKKLIEIVKGGDKWEIEFL